MPRVTLCRGCCCGTTKNRSDVDHAAQTQRLSSLQDAGVLTWRASECLGPCDRADVLVVHPSPAARSAGSRATWLGGVGELELELVVDWITAGGPGHSAVPAGLRPHLLPADRRSTT